MKYRYLNNALIFILLLFIINSTTALEILPDTKLTDEINQLIKSLDSPLNSTTGKLFLRTPLSVKNFYSNNPQPHWINKNQPSQIALAWIDILQQADRYGLEPNDYPIIKLKNDLTQITDKTAISLEAKLEVMLSDSFFAFADHLQHGRLDPVTLRPRSQRNTNDTVVQELLKNITTVKALKKAITSLEPGHSTYRRLHVAFENLKNIRKHGGWKIIPDGPILRVGDHDQRIVELRKRLTNSSSDLPNIKSDFFDNNLHKAVKAFQQDSKLNADGLIGPETLAKLNVSIDQRIRQVKNNLERWRWLPADLGSRFVSVNIPDFTLTMVDDNQVVGRMKVTAGRKDRPTPILSRQIQYLVFNPYWYVPTTITTKDFIPKIIAEPHYLEKLHIRVYLREEKNLKEIDHQTINWRQFSDPEIPFPFQLRQDPGPGNALGQVKFMFPNEQQIYLHDTPMRNLMNHSIRTDSSGCIRLENAIAMVNFVMQDNKNWSIDKTKELMTQDDHTDGETIVHLDSPLPVYITYFNAQVNNNGVLVFGADPYELDKE